MRRYRELWAWLGVLFLTLFAFFTAIAIAYFLKDARYSLFGNGWMLVAGLSFVAAFACFLAAATGWHPAMPRRPAFPDIRLEISAAGSVETEHETGTGLDVPTYLRSFTIRCSNAGTSQEAVLTVLLYVRLVPGSWGRVGEALCSPPSWVLPPSLNLSPVPQPFTLSPGEAVSGQLVFEIPRYYLDSIADPLEARLEIADQVSGKKMSAPAQIGHYDLSTLTPAEGGVVMLGPEYETHPEPRRDTDATPA